MAQMLQTKANISTLMFWFNDLEKDVIHESFGIE